MPFTAFTLLGVAAVRDEHHPQLGAQLCPHPFEELVLVPGSRKAQIDR